MKWLSGLIFLVFLWIPETYSQKSIDSLFTKIQQARHDSIRFRLFIDIAHEYKGKNLDSARMYYEKAASLSTIKKPLTEAKLFYQIGEIYAKQGAHDKALEWLKRAILLIEKNNNKDDLLQQILNETYFLTARIFSAKTEYDKAIDFYRNAAKGFLISGDKNLASRCYNNLGVVFYTQSLYDSSLIHYNTAINLRKEIHDTSGISNGLLNIAVVHMDKGEPVQALSVLQEALELKLAIKDTLGIAHCYNNLGNLHAELKNYNYAVEYFSKALELRRLSNDLEGIAGALINIGTTYSDNKEYHKSLEYFQEALSIATKLEDPSLMAHCYTNIGNAYKNLNDYPKAISYLEKSRKIRQNSANIIELANILTNLSALYYKISVEKSPYNREYISLAKSYAQQSYDLIKNSGYLNLEKTTADILMEIFKLDNNYTKALLMAEKTIALRDSIYSSEKIQQFAELDKKFQAALNKQLIENQKLTIEKQTLLLEATATRQKMLLIIGLLLSLSITTLVILAISIYRNYRIQQQYTVELKDLNNQILLQNEEINFQKSSLNKFNENLLNDINRARIVKNSLLGIENKHINGIKESFIINFSRHFVENDFVFVQEKPHGTLIVIYDSKTEGLSGLVLSVIGYTILREINNMDIDIRINILLEEFRARMKKLFPSSEKNLSSYTYDISALLIPKNKENVLFSSSKSSLYIVRHGEDENEAFLLEHSISPNINENKPFDYKNIPVYDGDQLYLFSESVLSSCQWNNDFEKFKEFLIQISTFPNEEQRDKIIEHLTNCNEAQEYCGLGIRL